MTRYLGGVVVTVDGSCFAEAGKRLALATGRRCLRSASTAVAVKDIGAEPTTIVLDPGDVTPNVLAALPPDRPVTVLTARDLPGLDRLIDRTLARHAVGRAQVFSVRAVHGGHTGRQEFVAGACSTTSDLALLHTHGRECGMQLSDGVLCARHGMTPAPGGRPTSCQQGFGCYRFGWGPDRVIDASLVRAGVVFADSCRSARVADGEFSAEVSLPLRFLDGEAVAFVGSPWVRAGLEDAGEKLSALVGQGLSLGECVRRLNAAIDDDPRALGHFVAIGDAAFRLVAPGSTAPVVSCAPEAPMARISETPFGVREPCGRAAVAELVERCAASMFSFYDVWDHGFVKAGLERTICPNCSATTLAVQRFTHQRLPEARAELWQCARCTEILEGQPLPGLRWEIRGPAVIERGAPFYQTVVLKNQTSEPLRCIVGAAVRDELMQGAELAGIREVSLPPGNGASIRFDGRMPHDPAVADMQYLKFPVAVGSHVFLLSRPVWLD